MKYRFMKKYSKEHCISKMANVLKINRSGYYRWFDSIESERARDNASLIELIKKYQDEFRYSYGSKRMAEHIRKEDKMAVGHNRIAKLMKKNNLNAKRKRKCRKPKEEKNLKIIIPNILDREFYVLEPNKVWVSDISYIRTQNGWNYLCVVMDLYSRKIIGWAIASRMDVELVNAAFYMALFNRKMPKKVLFHTDRGSQYCSNEFQAELKKHKFIQSLSRRGNCWDNACIESFFKSLKYEFLYPSGVKSISETRELIFEYIEVFYNRRRLHSTLDYMSPVEYEQKRA